MRLRSIGFVLGAWLLAAGTASAASCNVSAASRWIVGTTKVLRTEASANGPTCAQAAVTLVIRASDGTALWVDAAPGAQLMTFAGVKTRAQTLNALNDWLRQNPSFDNTGELGVWRAGRDTPESGEFAFYPEEGVDRAAYEALRAARLPMFCYVQGMESLACVVFQNGQVGKIGVQTFPG